VRLAPALRAAAAFLSRENWGQGLYFRDSDRSYCALGAIAAVRDGRQASDAPPPEDLTVATLEREIDLILNDLDMSASDIMEFNDGGDDDSFDIDCEPTVEDVQTLLLLLAECIDADASDAQLAVDIRAALAELSAPATVTAPADPVPA